MSKLNLAKKQKLAQQSKKLEEQKAKIDRELHLIEAKEQLAHSILNTLTDNQKDVHLCRSSHWIEYEGEVYKVNFSINLSQDPDEFEGISSSAKAGKRAKNQRGKRGKGTSKSRKSGKKVTQTVVPNQVAQALCDLLSEYEAMRKEDMVALIEENQIKGFDSKTMYADFKARYLEREGPNQGRGTVFKIKGS